MTVGNNPSEKNTETLLVVEDQVAVREVISEYLRREGYEVFEAADGVDALKIFNQYLSTIDLVVTDIAMPRMGGSEFAAQIQKLRPSIKILFISGFVRDLAFERKIIESEVHFLAKPFTLIHLAEKIREIINENGITIKKSSDFLNADFVLKPE